MLGGLFGGTADVDGGSRDVADVGGLGGGGNGGVGSETLGIAGVCPAFVVVGCGGSFGCCEDDLALADWSSLNKAHTASDPMEASRDDRACDAEDGSCCSSGGFIGGIVLRGN